MEPGAWPKPPSHACVLLGSHAPAGSLTTGTSQPFTIKMGWIVLGNLNTPCARSHTHSTHAHRVPAQPHISSANPASRVPSTILEQNGSPAGSGYPRATPHSPGAGRDLSQPDPEPNREPGRDYRISQSQRRTARASLFRRKPLLRVLLLCAMRFESSVCTEPH